MATKLRLTAVLNSNGARVGKEVKTSCEKGTNSPKWNSSYEFTIDDEFAGVVLRCYEKGTLTDRFIGIATISLAAERIAKKRVVKWYNLSKQAPSQVVSGDLQLEFDFTDGGDSSDVSSRKASKSPRKMAERSMSTTEYEAKTRSLPIFSTPEPKSPRQSSSSVQIAIIPAKSVLKPEAESSGSDDNTKIGAFSVAQQGVRRRSGGVSSLPTSPMLEPLPARKREVDEEQKVKRSKIKRVKSLEHTSRSKVSATSPRDSPLKKPFSPQSIQQDISRENDDDTIIKRRPVQRSFDTSSPKSRASLAAPLSASSLHAALQKEAEKYEEEQKQKNKSSRKVLGLYSESPSRESKTSLKMKDIKKGETLTGTRPKKARPISMFFTNSGGYATDSPSPERERTSPSARARALAAGFATPIISPVVSTQARRQKRALERQKKATDTPESSQPADDGSQKSDNQPKSITPRDKDDNGSGNSSNANPSEADSTSDVKPPEAGSSSNAKPSDADISSDVKPPEAGSSSDAKPSEANSSSDAKPSEPDNSCDVNTSEANPSPLVDQNTPSEESATQAAPADESHTASESKPNDTSERQRNDLLTPSAESTEATTTEENTTTEGEQVKSTPTTTAAETEASAEVPKDSNEPSSPSSQPESEIVISTEQEQTLSEDNKEVQEAQVSEEKSVCVTAPQPSEAQVPTEEQNVTLDNANDTPETSPETPTTAQPSAASDADTSSTSTTTESEPTTLELPAATTAEPAKTVDKNLVLPAETGVVEEHKGSPRAKDEPTLSPRSNSPRSNPSLTPVTSPRTEDVTSRLLQRSTGTSPRQSSLALLADIQSQAQIDPSQKAQALKSFFLGISKGR